MALAQYFRLLAIYACGVLAAAQYGKLATLAPLIQAELGAGLVTMAAAVGLIEAGGAFLGLRAGLFAQQLGLHRAMVAALTILALAGLGSASAFAAPDLIVWRLLEAIGYLGVVVSAPALIMQAAPHIASRALAIWSTCVPVGFALGAWAHSALATATNWRVAVAADSIPAAALLVAVWAARTRTDAATLAPLQDARQTIPAAARHLAASYGCFVACRVGVFALLPSLLVTQSGLTVAETGLWTSAVTFSTVVGGAIATVALSWPDRQHSLSAVSLLLPAVLIFVVFAGSASPLVIGSAAVAMFVLLGIFGGLAFGWLAMLSGGTDRSAASFGFLAQCGATGALLGPPVMAATVQHGSWASGAGLGLVLLAASLVLAYKALGPRPARLV